MTSKVPDWILDFDPIGMRWKMTGSTADIGGELFEAINVVVPGFAGRPLHVHPQAEASCQVIAGTLDVCVGGEWRELKPGVPRATGDWSIPGEHRPTERHHRRLEYKIDTSRLARL